MNAIRSVFVLYNPNSTGPARKKALALQKALAKNPATSCKLVETEHENHAVELAKDYAGPGVLLVSSSGDGGFHELINGVLASGAAQQTIVGLLPSGNANDHYTARHTGDIAARIAVNDHRAMDVLELTWNGTTLYAHSYAGLGITADIGRTMTEARPNSLTEPWHVLVGLITRRPVRIIVDGRKRRYDSLVVNLIGTMSKYLTTGTQHRPSDGTFDLMVHNHASLAELFRHLIHHAVADDIRDAPSRRSLSFTTTRSLPIQLDGEVYTIPRYTVVQIQCLPGALRSIV